jgi:2-polyprenyl-3-methyl-5-hydroxy-6-metoxy-1,4-benzoquinol methylase
MRFTGSHSIALTIKNFIIRNQRRFKDQVVLDVPAGKGETAGMLQEVGARVIALDLFPESFEHPSINCGYADLNKALPVESGTVDFVFCQEGIEHVSDQPAALRELSRILKPTGKLLISTPNPSNLRSRISHLLGESEHYKLMPPNELDTVWLSKEKGQEENIYYGHTFLIGFPKLRFLARLAGFSVHQIYYDRANNLSVALLPLLYPWIALTAFTSYRRALRKRQDISPTVKKAVYREVLKAAIDPRNLIVSHIFIEFEKTSSAQGAVRELRASNKLSS